MGYRLPMTRRPPSSPDPAHTVPDAAPGNWVDRAGAGGVAALPAARALRSPDRRVAAAVSVLGGARRWPSSPSAGPIPISGTSRCSWLGAFVMRGAGCTYNDIVDRDYDAQRRAHGGAAHSLGPGQRHRRRGCSSPSCARVGLLVLIQFNLFTIVLGAASLLLIAIYPFMKRLTYWPQLVLGLTFKWGALVGWAAVTGSLSLAAIALYAGSVLWTIGYDTIYAHQDKEDDLLLGLKSTALQVRRRDAALARRRSMPARCCCGRVAGVLAGAHVAFLAGPGAVGRRSSPGRWRRSTPRSGKLPGPLPLQSAGRLAAVRRAGGRHGRLRRCSAPVTQSVNECIGTSAASPVNGARSTLARLARRA